MFSIIVGAVMAVAFIGMIVCVKKQNDNPNAKPLAVGLLLVVIVCAVVMLIHNMGGGAESAVVDSEIRYTVSVPYMVGKTVADKMPGAKVLVVTSSDQRSNKIREQQIEALKKGFGSTITDIVCDSPKPSKAPANMEPDMVPEDFVTAKDLDRLFKSHKDRNLIVMLIRLPYDMENMEIWRQFKKNPKKTPKLALAASDVSLLGAYIKGGLISAASVHNPDYKYEDGKIAPEDLEKAFNERYLMLTPENVLQMAKKYPKLFPKPRR